MAKLKLRKALRTLLLLSPVVLFCILSLASILRGGEGPWHSRCVEFWQQQQYYEIVNLARNLQGLRKPDAEVYFLASLAAEQIHDSNAAQEFKSEFHKLRILNWNKEMAEEPSRRAASIREHAASLRTRIVAAIISLLIVFNLLAAIGKRFALPLSSLFACLGIGILLL